MLLYCIFVEPGEPCAGLRLKSFETSNPIFQYAYTQSSRLQAPMSTIFEVVDETYLLHCCLQKTQAQALPPPLKWTDTIAPEVTQLMINLMRLYKPKRSLVIGE